MIRLEGVWLSLTTKFRITKLTAKAAIVIVKESDTCPESKHTKHAHMMFLIHEVDNY